MFCNSCAFLPLAGDGGPLLIIGRTLGGIRALRVFVAPFLKKIDFLVSLFVFVADVQHDNAVRFFYEVNADAGAGEETEFADP